MKPTQPSPRASMWLSMSVLSAFVAFAASTFSPLSILLVAGFAASLVLPARMPRDSANIWGLRLLIYAGGAILGRTISPSPSYAYDARAFVTPGVILGGEIILQSFRVPPRGLRYDPVIILLTGLIFLISSNTLQPTLFVLAPIYIFCTLVALRDARADAPAPTFRIFLQRLGFLSMACLLGTILHLQLWAYRANIMALGARLLSTAQTRAQGDNIGDNPQLSTTFNANTSTTRLISIKGTLPSQHLRTAAFDTYNKGTWGPPLTSRTPQIAPALPKDTNEANPKNPGGDNRTDTDATLTVLRDTGGILFFPLNASAIVPRNGGSFDWKRYDGPVKTDDAPPIVYAIVNSKQEIGGFEWTQGPLCVAPNAQQRQQLLAVPPEIDPRVRKLALDITRGAPTETVKVARITKYLLDHYKYSFEFIRSDKDPVSDFILNKKAGHCQYFASAATILMRCAGVPARYASGYFAHEQATDGTTIVRGRDGHAWTEAYVTYTDTKTGNKRNGFKKGAWISVDATVPIGRADANVNPLPVFQKASEWVQDTFSRVRDWFGRLTALQIAEIMGFVLLVWGLERWRQTRKKARQKPQRLPLPAELAPLAQRFERVLAKRGISLIDEQPWSESVPPEFEAEARWVALYNRIRFSHDSGNELDDLRGELEALEKDRSRPNSSTTHN